MQLFAGGILALVALGIGAVQWLAEAPSVPVVHWFWTVFIHLWLVWAMVCFAISLARFYVGGSSTTTATESMEIVQADIDGGLPSKHVVFNKTYNAYFELKERNARERHRLQVGKRWFYRGVIAVLVVVFVYLLASLPTKMQGAMEQHGKDDIQDGQWNAADDSPARRGGHDGAAPRE